MAYCWYSSLIFEQQANLIEKTAHLSGFLFSGNIHFFELCLFLRSMIATDMISSPTFIQPSR